MNISVTLAARYLWGRKLRTLLTTLAVVFGVAVIFGLNSMLPTVMDTFLRSMMSSAGQVDLSVTSASGATFKSEAADKLERVRGIKAVSATLRRPVAMPKGFAVSTLTAVGLEPQSARHVRTYPVESGRMLDPGDRGVIALPAALAKKLNLHVGSSMTIPTVNGAETYRVIGVLAVMTTPGSEEVYMTLPDAQALFGEGSRISHLEAAFEPEVDRATVERAASTVLGDAYTVGGVEAGSELLASLQVGKVMLNMFGVFALAMGGFIILNTFRTVVAERRHDIGMLRAVGASRRTILGIFLTESLLQGLLGTAMGLVAGYFLAAGVVAALNPVYSDYLNMQIEGPKFEVSSFFLAIGLGIGVTVLSALAPAFSAARITPLEALRPKIGDVEERERSRKAWVGFVMLLASGAALVSGNTSLVGLAAVGVLVGLILVAPELIAPVSNIFGRLVDLIFRTEGEIARSNMQRQPARAATTAAAVMISLAIIIALMGVMTSIFEGFMAYVDKSVGVADFVILPTNFLLGGGNVGAGDDFVAKVRDTPGVQNVATLRITKGSVNDSPVQVIGIDPREYPKVASFEFSEGGGTHADIALLGTGRMLIANGIYAAQNGIRVGDTLKMVTANGTKSYEVAAVGSDYLNAKLATVYVSQERMREDFGTETNAAVLANAHKGADVAAVNRMLTRVARDYPQLTLFETESFRKMQEDTFAQVMVMMYAMIVILAVPSLLALLNNLAMSVIARTREIGMLRAVGSTRAQIRRMVLAEALLLAAVGVVFGLVAGIVLGYSFTVGMNNVGFSMPYRFPWGGIVAGVVIGFVFAAVAALIPARQAARLDIVKALQYE